MKISKLIQQLKEALNRYGDIEINAYMMNDDNWYPIIDYNPVVIYDEDEEELLIQIG